VTNFHEEDNLWQRQLHVKLYTCKTRNIGWSWKEVQSSQRSHVSPQTISQIVQYFPSAIYFLYQLHSEIFPQRSTSLSNIVQHFPSAIYFLYQIYSNIFFPSVIYIFYQIYSIFYHQRFTSNTPAFSPLRSTSYVKNTLAFSSWIRAIQWLILTKQ
jgi:hypothetical protein